MRFFFDENMSPAVIDPLRPIFAGEHELISIHSYDGGRLVSADDKVLLRDLHDFDALVTMDRSLLVDHRESLTKSGLHWVGLRQPKVDGLHGLAHTSACLLAGMPHALDVMREWKGKNGCWVVVRGMQREQNQRIKVMNKPILGNVRRLASRGSA